MKCVCLHIIIWVKTMTKNTMANKLPRKLTQKMQIVGEQIRLARLRRNLSMAQVADRATCSEVTLCKVEKGLPTVSIGIYLRVLYALQLDDDILLLAKDDHLGRALQDMGLKNRQRATKKDRRGTTWFTREDKPLLASRTHPEGIPNGGRSQNSSVWERLASLFLASIG